MSRAPLRVAVLGAGTVGREVVRAFLERPATLRTTDGAGLELVGVAVRDVARAIERGVPEALLTDAPAHLVADPTIDIVVELVGGSEPARTILAAALGAGKAVVTANKHVLAHDGPALEAIARRTGAALRFEAAVGGGIPVLGPLAADLAANRVQAVRGIVNGTTNYLLTEMAAGSAEYADVLARAQAAGYAEADPTADVEGIDAINKLVILARLAFGVWLDPATIVDRVAGDTGHPGGRPGITGVTGDDLAAARDRDLVIKLVAVASRHDPDGPAVAAAVLASALPAVSDLGRTNGVTNRIEIEAEPVGRVAFVGPGAGGVATSSAVLGDLLALARNGGSTWAGLPPAGEGSAGPPPEAPSSSGPPASPGPPLSPGRPAAPEPSGAAWFDAPSGARYPILAP